MRLHYALQDGCLRLSLQGELGHHEAIDLMAQIDAVLEDLLPGAAVLDFSELDFMDSSGIAVVVQTARKCAACGCDFSLEHLPKQAQKVLCTAGMDRLVRIRQEDFA